MIAEPNLLYLFAAYTVVWVILFGYIAILKKRIADLTAKLRELVIS